VAGVFSKYHAFHSGQGTGMDMNPLARGEVPLVIDWRGQLHLCVQSSAILAWARRLPVLFAAVKLAQSAPFLGIPIVARAGRE